MKTTENSFVSLAPWLRDLVWIVGESSKVISWADSIFKCSFQVFISAYDVKLIKIELINFIWKGYPLSSFKVQTLIILFLRKTKGETLWIYRNLHGLNSHTNTHIQSFNHFVLVWTVCQLYSIYIYGLYPSPLNG